MSFKALEVILVGAAFTKGQSKTGNMDCRPAILCTFHSLAIFNNISLSHPTCDLFSIFARPSVSLFVRTEESGVFFQIVLPSPGFPPIFPSQLGFLAVPPEVVHRGGRAGGVPCPGHQEGMFPGSVPLLSVCPRGFQTCGPVSGSGHSGR